MPTRFPLFALLGLVICAQISCDTDTDNTPQEPQLVFRFKFDSQQERLDNFGQPVIVPQGNAAQSPDFNKISAHYVELIPNAITQLGDGQLLYRAPETTAGGGNAIDFSQAVIVGEHEIFLSVPLSSIAANSYPYIRISLSYQNYNILFNAQGFNQLTGTLASFIGFNNYLTTYNIGNESVAVNGNRLQGYWGFETVVNVLGQDYVSVTEGQVPEGFITVPNPLASTSPIPAGSCLVTGSFEIPLQITGNETENIEVLISISTNNSFEWSDPDGNGQYDPLDGDVPVDMGVRGLKAIVQ
ncbi:MAG: hypothetical protein K9J06_01305 [Flavobacteriales bacterium]|nr:hypothetical protein [Flavobacteriales bacterium]